MQTILTGFAARSLTRELADRDAHQLRDIGLVRAADGSLRLLNDPSVEAVPPARRARQAHSWGRWIAGFFHPSQRLKTAL
ncbi:MAG TPA: hypothetical protein VHE77_05120 [Dongiaceae bacterium]|jgi:hypothetical protein|nr:hypothetical protein [Dongiaceae bacterium]